MFLQAKNVDMLWFDAVKDAFLFFVESGIEGHEMDIVKQLFSDHPFLCVCMNMSDSSDWGHFFVHISMEWTQGGGRGSLAEWGSSECC